MLVTDWISVTMHELPGSVLPPERACHPEIEGSNTIAVADPCSPRLVLDDTGEIVGDVCRDSLEPSDLSPTEA